jgi:hypothetical protein
MWPHTSTSTRGALTRPRSRWMWWGINHARDLTMSKSPVTQLLKKDVKWEWSAYMPQHGRISRLLYANWHCQLTTHCVTLIVKFGLYFTLIGAKKVCQLSLGRLIIKQVLSTWLHVLAALAMCTRPVIALTKVRWCRWWLMYGEYVYLDATSLVRHTPSSCWLITNVCPGSWVIRSLKTLPMPDYGLASLSTCLLNSSEL